MNTLTTKVRVSSRAQHLNDGKVFTYISFTEKDITPNMDSSTATGLNANLCVEGAGKSWELGKIYHLNIIGVSDDNG